MAQSQLRRGLAGGGRYDRHHSVAGLTLPGNDFAALTTYHPGHSKFVEKIPTLHGIKYSAEEKATQAYIDLTET